MDGLFDFSTPITEDITLNAMWTCADVDPTNPTFPNLKAALATSNPSAIYPIGTLIPDKYGGVTNIDWRIVHYGTATRAADAQEVSGAYLMCTIALGGSQVMSSPWPSSGGHTTLNTSGSSYLYGSLSQTVKDSVVEILNPYVTAGGTPGISTSTDKFFLPAISQISGSSNPGTGQWWNYFKGKMGGVMATHSSSWVYTNTSGTNITWWTRDGSTQSPTYSQTIDNNGNISYSPNTGGAYLIPCCFVAA